MADKIRIVISKIGLDGHDKGTKIIASLLREAGMEVVYLGMYQTPEAIVKAAVQEDVDIIGVSTHCGEHLTLVPKLLDKVRQEKLDDMLVVVGGVIPAEDVATLRSIGVDEVFVSGMTSTVIVEGIQKALERKRQAKLAAPVQA